MKFLLDANFLILPAQFKVDIFSELRKFGRPELYTLDLVVDELKKLAKAQGRSAVNAKLALDLLKKKNVEVLKTKEKKKSADDELLMMAGMGYIVCTQDAGLIKRLKAKKSMAVTLRQKKHLVEV